MTISGWLSTQEVSRVFQDAIEGLGGTVSDRYDDGGRLYSRAILPSEREVKRGDRLQGGVALRADQTEIAVSPYLFRQVCTNGMIRAQAVGACTILASEFEWEADQAAATRRIEEAIEACAAPEVFAESTRALRATVDVELDIVLALMPMLRGLPQDLAAGMLEQITRRFRADRDRSYFGLVNAITSVARDTRDPERRWRLEELGGAVALVRRPRSGSPQAAAVESVLV